MAKDEFGFEIKKPTTSVEESPSLMEQVSDANIGKFKQETDEFGFPIKTLDTQETSSGVDEFGFPIKTLEPPRPDYGLGELASTSLKRGFRQTSSLVGDVIPAVALSALGFDEAAERQMEEARASQEYIQRNLPAQFPSFRDVEWTNPLDVGKFVVEAMGENATNLIPILGLGATGTKVGANIASKKAFENLVDKKVSQKVKDRITSAAARKGANVGQVGGVFLGSYSLNVPETFRGIYEETGTFEPGAALLAGVVNASLDSIFPVTLLRGFSQPARAGIVSKVLERSGMNPSLANSAVTKVLGAAALEGVTEGSQEAVNITTENFVQDHSFVFDSKDYDRVLEGAVKGAAAGGGYRATGEAVNKIRKEVSEFNAKKSSATTPPITTPSTTQDDAKVAAAQKLDEQQAAERVAREGEQKRLQQELDEKILTEEGVDEVLTNMNKYFSGNNQSEINVIRNNLRKVQAELKKNRPERDPIILEDLLNKVTEKVKVEQPKIIKSKPKPISKENLEQQVLDFITQQSNLGIRVTKNTLVQNKDFRIGPKKAGEILKGLRSEFKIQGDKGKNNQIEYASLDFVPLPEKKKDYAGIKKADSRAVPLKVGKSTKREGLFTGQASTVINHMLNLAGVLGVNAVNMDVNLQKRLVREFNKTLLENPKDRPDDITRDIKNQSDIDNDYLTKVFSQQSLDALKDYAQETQDDYSTRQRIAGATAAPNQTRVGSSTETPISTTEEAVAKSTEEADRTPVATTGPDTGQFTGGERGIYPTLGGQNFTEGKKITVKTPNGFEYRGFYRREDSRLYGDIGTVVYPRIGQADGIQNIEPEDIVTDIEVDAAQKRKLKTTRKGDPRDKEIINKLKSKRTLGQVLAILDKEKITTTQKELVTVLLSLPNIKDVRFNIVKDSDLDANTFGEYDVKDNFIKVGVSGDVQAVLHEATHAATANQLTKHIAIDGKNKTPEGQRLIELYNTTVRAADNRFEKELENIDEFVTNAFNNPEFQQFLADTESPFSTEFLISEARAKLTDEKASEYVKRNIADSYRGKPLEETIDSAWTGFVKAVKQIINPKKLDLRSSVLNDVIALAPELFVGPNPAEQAQGRQGKLFKKGEESKTISEENVKSFDFKVKLIEPTVSSDPNQINESDVDTTETEKALSSEDALLNQATGPNIVTDEEAAARAKNDVDITKNAEFYSGDAVELLASEESYFTKQFNVVADIIQGLPIAKSGLGETIANKFSNIPAGLARVYAGFISIGQSEELYGVRLPGLGVLKRLIEQKATITKSGFEEISYVVQYVEDILNKYNTTPEGRATVKEWNEVIFKLSGLDTDPEAMINEPNAEHVPSRKKLEDGTFETTTNQEFLNANPEIAALVTRYNALPEDLKAAARRMVEDLRTKYTRLLEATIAANPESESEIRARFTMRPYYIPFIRRGDYWFSYMDTETGKKGYGSAASPSARRKEMQRIQDSGIGTDVKISNKADVASAGLGPDRNIDAFVQNIQDSFKNLDFSGIPDAQQAGIKEALTKTLKENYLALFPDQSLRNQQTHRAAVPGYIEDVLLSYSDVAPKITSSLSNTMHNRQIIEQINAIQIQANREENRNNNIIQGVAASALKRTSFFLNPIAESWAALAAYGSYYWFLGMNPSSALINYTQLPLVVMPFLSAEYGGATGGGIARAYKAMHEAHRLYFRQGGREQSKSFGNDYTMAPYKVNYATGEKTYTGKEAEDFAPKGAKIEITQRDGKVIKKIAKEDGKYYSLFDAAESSQTVRRGISYEATELSRQTGASFDKPNRLGGKIDTLVGWMFQNSERLNREVTLVAAFNLEMEKQLGERYTDTKKRKAIKNSKEYKEAEQKATAKAIDLTVRAHSHALPEAGPEFFQNGLPKVMTIFKRFAQQQIYLVAKLFQTVLPKSGDYVDPNTGKKLEGKALDNYKKERRIAAERLIGIYAASIALAGIQGAPLYGIVKILTELIMDDEDEPFDLDTFVAQEFGNTLYGGPVNKVLGIDMSRRTGFRDMLFREDPQRLEELGFVLYSLETLGGPAISIATRTTDGLTEIFGDEGFNVRSTEKLLPTALGNTLKAYRQANEGVLNKRGVPIADDPNLWQTGKQIFGFTSQEVSLAYRKANSLKAPERKLYQRRSRLLLEYWLALRSGDADGLLDVKEEIVEYNSKAPPSFRIANSTISRSMSNRRKLEKRAFNGVDVKNRAELEQIFGIPDD